MKKECTQQQLDELLALGYKGGNTIGDFIEFLGDDLIAIGNHKDHWYLSHIVPITDPLWAGVNKTKEKKTIRKKLIDVLCKAVKYKITNNNYA